MRLVDADELKTVFGEEYHKLIDDHSIKVWGDSDMISWHGNYILMLHKEFGVSLMEAEKAHETALKYLQNKAMCKA